MEWDSATNTWKNYSTIQYLYNEHLMIQSEITRFWSGGNQWVNSFKFDFEYSEENKKLKQRTRFLWVNNFGWDVTTRTLYSYNDNLKLVEALSQVWEEFENKWYNTAVYSYVYNALDQRTETLYRSWDFNGHWVNESETLYTYNDDGNLTQYVFRIWDDINNVWMNYYKYVNYWSEFMPFRISKISGLVIYIYPMVTNGVDEIAFQENVKMLWPMFIRWRGKFYFKNTLNIIQIK